MGRVYDQHSRNSYFPPQIEMTISYKLFDEDEDRLDHWRVWTDEQWIKRIRECLPLTDQSTDHVMDCNHIIDKLVLEIDFNKENSEAKYIEQLHKMEMEIVQIYITDQRKVANLIDRLIRKIGRDAPYRGNEQTRTDLHFFLKEKQRENKLTSIPRFCGIIGKWLYGRW